MTAYSGQAKPNFSGKWTIVPDPAAGGRGGADEELTITQDATALTLEQMSLGRERAMIRLVYKLDGTETPQTISRNQVVTKAVWDGDKLVTTVKGATADWKDVWSLQNGQLVIVTTTPGRTLTITKMFKKSQ